MQAELAARQEAKQGSADRAAFTVRANARAQQARESQLRAEQEAQQAQKKHQQIMEQLQAARMAAPPDRWTLLASGIETEEDLMGGGVPMGLRAPPLTAHPRAPRAQAARAGAWQARGRRRLQRRAAPGLALANSCHIPLTLTLALTLTPAPALAPCIALQP